MMQIKRVEACKARRADLVSAIEELAFAPANVRTLSVYLDTSPERIQGQAYLMSFHDRCRELRRHIAAEDTDAFEQTRSHVDYCLSSQVRLNSPGLALFALAESNEVLVVPLPAAPSDHVVWSEHPSIVVLQAMAEQHGCIGVALFDAERARLFSVFLNAIESQRELVDAVPGKQATGGWFGLEQDHFARHRQDHVRRHAARTARALMALFRKRPFERLLLAGPDEPLAVLERELPQPLRDRRAGTLSLPLSASDADVLGAVREAAELMEEKAEQRLVEDLLDSASTPHVALGVARVLDAIANGRLHMLLVAGDFEAAGAECMTCGRLTVQLVTCPACGGPTHGVSSLREAVVERALGQSATVKTVSGVAAAQLRNRGGIGGWTRF
jgi:hypothetical protein